MRTFYLLSLFTFLQVIACAQFKVVAEGLEFDEPEFGYARILQMKNGNTLCFYISQEETIDVSIYDEKHTRKVQKHLDPQMGKSKGFRINSVFEIGGNAAIFISEVNNKHPELFRLLIDGNTGELKDEQKIAETDRYPSRFRSIIPEYRQDSSFFIRKDPDSDHYGVVILHNNDNSATRKAVEVVLFDSLHKEINRNYYVPPFQRYRYFDYLDMAVMGGDKLTIIGFGYDQLAEDYKDGQLVVSNLDKGVDHMIANDLSVRDGQIIDSAILKYNPITKKLFILGSSHYQGDKKEQYAGFLAILDPYTQKVEKEINIYPEKAAARKAELLGRKHTLTAMPQQIFIEKDGGFTVIYEELTNKIITPLNSTPYVYCYLDNAAVATFDLDGNQLSSSLIPKSQVMRYMELSSFYLSDRPYLAQKLTKGDQYKSFMYLDGKNKKYILLNDVFERTEDLKKGRVTTIRSLGDCDIFYYEIDGKSDLPGRDYLFGKPEKEDDHNMAIFTVSDYDREHNIFVTLKLQKKGRVKSARVVWLNP
jgi:hypothetical protein